MASRWRRLLAATVVLAALLPLAACGGDKDRGTRNPSGSQAPPPGSAPQPAGPVVADVDELLGDRVLFGITTHDPAEAALADVALKLNCRPSVVQLFASVEKGISAKRLAEVPGTPLLAMEPWHNTSGRTQPAWTLASTIDGQWDERYEAIARAVVAYGKPILIRFGHEMNGHWYPWGTRNGNRRGEFITAWRHVVEIFRAAGATNALWVWSPNILRGADSRTIKEFWPGDQYVDVVGVTGYGVREATPETTYRATLKQVYALTRKKILLTEVGVQPGPEKENWLRRFGPWLRDNPRVAGFIWYQVVRQGDWRFDDTPANLAAFRSGLAAADPAC
ncbi:glycoside hydrolase family 26 protein [Micromonospora sp. SL4-19]|uniref:glycoside hydrolase family 26 protein n=1 Tax=Micromonospora sp. SL4-19 TaxID=3399129 RepID=UPI003A4D2871